MDACGSLVRPEAEGKAAKKHAEKTDVKIGKVFSQKRYSGLCFDFIIGRKEYFLP